MGAVTLANEINRVRVVFKYAFDEGILDRPVRYGASSKRPSRKVLRAARVAKGPRMFEAAELRALIDKAGVPLKAMILLGINAALGNTDVAALPLSAVDLKNGWLNYPRAKTAIGRRCPLWPETIIAIEAAIAKRPEPSNEADSGRLFVTRRRQSWLKDSMDDPVAKEMTKLLKACDLHRPGLGFYALRHTFETIGGESKDQVAVNAIMGHAPAASDMSAVYRERVSDDRLRAVVDHVRVWLWPPKPAAKRKAATKAKPKAKPTRSRKKAVAK